MSAETQAKPTPDYVLVPREPTEAMLCAALECPISTSFNQARAVWSAMIAVSPPPSEMREEIARIVAPEFWEGWEGYPLGQRDALAKADAIITAMGRKG